MYILQDSTTSPHKIIIGNNSICVVWNETILRFHICIEGQHGDEPDGQRGATGANRPLKCSVRRQSCVLVKLNDIIPLLNGTRTSRPIDRSLLTYIPLDRDIATPHMSGKNQQHYFSMVTCITNWFTRWYASDCQNHKDLTETDELDGWAVDELLSGRWIGEVPDGGSDNLSLAQLVTGTLRTVDLDIGNAYGAPDVRNNAWCGRKSGSNIGC
jgi:hypothetical protein